MEKYTRFSDAATGVNPFLPVWVMAPRSNTLIVFVKFTLWIPFFVIRVLILVVGIILLLLAHLLSLPVYCCGGAHRATLLFLATPGLFLILTALGVLIQIKPADARRLKLRPDRQQPARQVVEQLQSGDVLLSNFTGPVDVIFLTYMYRPLFVHVHGNDSVDIASPLQMFIKSLRHSQVDGNVTGKFSSIATLCAEGSLSAPIVVFPEVNKSNNTAILRWTNSAIVSIGPASQFEDMISHLGMGTIQYDQSSRKFSPPHTVYNGWYHLFRLMWEKCHRLQFTWVRKSQVEELIANNGYNGSNPGAVLALLRQSMKSLMPNVQLVTVDGSRLQEFAEYFSKTQTSKYRDE